MFYLKREREERAKGLSEEAALEAAAATSGRSVLISGSTVIVAMAGMFLTGDSDFASFGAATITVVAVAMLGSLTVLPALLSKLGDNVDRLPCPFVHRLRRDDGEGPHLGRDHRSGAAPPALSAALAAGVLVALAVPAIQLHTANPSIDTYPQNLLQTYNRMKAAFPGTQVAASVVVKAPNVEAPAMKEAIGQLEWRALSRGVMYEPIDVDVNEAKTVANISIPVKGTGRLDVQRGARGPTRRDRPRDRRQRPRRRSRRHRRNGAVEGLQRPDEDRRAARVRLRPAVRVRADARVVPLARDRRPRRSSSTCCRSERPTGSSSSSSSMAGESSCWASSSREGSTPSCRSCCS
jgi:hypothetical protein